MLKTKLKASAVTNLTDARYFAAWEVEWLGFCLDPQAENYIPPRDMKAMKEWVDGVKIVGEFDLQSAEEIRSAIDLLELDAIQVGPFTEVDTLMDLQSSVPVIKELIFSRDTSIETIESSLEQFAAHTAYFLFNFDKNGLSLEHLSAAGATISYTWLKEICEQYPVLLSISIAPEQLESLLSDVRLEGLNVVGGEEEKVGYKSFDELDELFEVLEVQI